MRDSDLRSHRCRTDALLASLLLAVLLTLPVRADDPSAASSATEPAAIAWIRENAVDGPAAPVVAQISEALRSASATRRNCFWRVGAGRFKDGAQMLFLHDGGFFHYPLSEDQVQWYGLQPLEMAMVCDIPGAAKAPERIAVRLFQPVLHDASAIAADAPIVGSVPYAHGESAPGVHVTLRLVFVRVIGSGAMEATTWSPVPALEHAYGTLSFAFPPLDPALDIRGPVVAFLSVCEDGPEARHGAPVSNTVPVALNVVEPTLEERRMRTPPPIQIVRALPAED